MTRRRGTAKGNWYVHQRGASSVAYPSKDRARRAARSLQNAKVSRYYRPGAGGRHSVSDTKPDTGSAGCAGLVLGFCLTLAVAGVSAARHFFN